MPPADHELRAQARVGTVLRGKYALERVLGTGGMGAVYLGVHRNGHRVAVKVLHAEASADPDVRARFLREGYVANSIGHPGAVRVLDDDVAEDGAAFLVMELLEGETLHVRAKRHMGRLPNREVLFIGRALCDVLAAAHEKGVVHRDIKPENLFLTTGRTLKVLDFGIARGGTGLPATSRRAGPGGVAIEGGTRAGAALGTPAFMPPEQALGHSRDVDARSDVWAVGATLFSLLSGKLVHEAPSQQELLVRAATCPARSLAEAASDVPAPIVAVVDRALRFSRDERWPSARAMAEAIDEAYLAVFGEPVAASALGPVPSALAAPSPRGRGGEQATRQAPVEDTLLAAGAGRTTKEALTTGTGFPNTQADTFAPLSPQGASTRDGASTTSPGVHAAAPTLPAGGEPTPPPSRASGPVLLPHPSVARASTRAPSTPPPAPHSERTGKAVGLGLTLAVAVALLVAHVRRPAEGEAPSLDAAGHAPCFRDTDCRAAVTVGGDPPHPPAQPVWVCGPAGRCVERRGEGRGGCTSSRACVEAAHGQAAICRADGACVPLASPECHVLAEPGDIGNDATLWVGAMFPQHGTMGREYGVDELRLVDLARRDFAEITGGLPPTHAGGPKRPIAVVACDDTDDPARVAAHLVDDVHVPAVLGFAVSKEVVDLADTVWNPKGVLALATNTASMLRAIPHAPGQPRMVWRTTRSSDLTVPVDAAVVAQVIEPELRAKPGLLAPGEPIRVALARIGNSSGLGYADLCVSTLRFNGKSAAENGASFRQMVYADVSRDDQIPGELDRMAREIVAFQPHIVINAMDEPLIPAVEKLWPASARFRPYYVPAHLEDPAIQALVQQHPDARRRIFEVETTIGSPAVAKLVLRNNQVFPDKPVTAFTAHGATYDAFYTLAYAAAALGDQRITGPALARAIPRLLPPGEPIDVGPGSIYKALTLLGSGKNIDLAGSTTSLDFDLETGEAPADFEVFCLAPGEGGGLPTVAESGLVYRARTKTLEGKLRCP